MSEPKMHYEGCWMGRVHHDCTVRMVQYLQSGLAQAREELVTADAAMDAVQALWRSPAEARRQDANLAQARNELSQRLVERISDVHIIREAGGKLDRARAELLQARAELKDLHETDHKFGRLTILRNRDYWYDKAVAAECECDEWRKKAQVHLATLDAAETALAAERVLRQEAEQEIAEMKISLHKTLNVTKTPGAWPEGKIMTITERIFGLNSKLQFTEAELNEGHKALSKCQVNSVYEDGEEMSVATRIFWLNDRATRAEALAQLVTVELAVTLDRLAHEVNYSRSEEGMPTSGEANDAYSLAEQIREALGDN